MASATRAVRLLLASVAAARGINTVDFALVSSASLKTHPAAKRVSARSLWQDGTCLIYVARRLG